MRGPEDNILKRDLVAATASVFLSSTSMKVWCTTPSIFRGSSAVMPEKSALSEKTPYVSIDLNHSENVL